MCLWWWYVPINSGWDILYLSSAASILIPLGGIDARWLSRLVSFFYSGLLRVESPGEALSLLRAADMLLLDQTKEHLARWHGQKVNYFFLQKKKTPPNLLSFYPPPSGFLFPCRYLQQTMSTLTCVSCKRAASDFGLQEGLGKAADR